MRTTFESTFNSQKKKNLNLSGYIGTWYGVYDCFSHNLQNFSMRRLSSHLPVIAGPLLQ